MNQNLLQLKNEFGKYGSWALWDEDYNISPFVNRSNFENIIKPNIVFVGFCASKKLTNKEDWANYHFGHPNYQRLADIILEKEFAPYFKGAYMTDIIKTHIDGNSKKIDEILKEDQKCNGSIIEKNKVKIKRELELLSAISSKEPLLICIGGGAYEWTKQISEVRDSRIRKIYHYAQPFRNDDKEIRNKIKTNLREVLQSIQL